MKRERNISMEIRVWKMAGRVGGHLMVGWMVSNLISLFISPILWTDLEYVRQVPLVPFLLMTAAGSMVSGFLEMRQGEEKYHVKKKALFFLLIYLITAIVLALIGMSGLEGKI